MDLKEVYKQVQGNYEDVMRRFMSEERVKKYLLKLTQEELFLPIKEALEAEDYETAFRESHNLKGLCANLGLEKLCLSAADLTEILRNGKPSEDVTPYLTAVEEDYSLTMQGLKKMQE